MKIDIEQIKADREVGNEWWVVDGDFIVDDCSDRLAMMVTHDQPDVYARRIARVPDLEAALIEAAGLIEDVYDQLNGGVHVEEETFLALKVFLERFK